MKNFNRASLALVFCIGGLTAGLAHAQSSAATPSAKLSVDDTTEGEVRKVDKANKTIVLKHGEVKSIGMMAMTMMWPVSDAALLDKVKPGDKIRFKVGYRGGTYVVTDIKPAK